MWSLETIVQINQAHAQTGDARKAYEACGIRVSGDCPVASFGGGVKLPVQDVPIVIEVKEAA